jgi:transposase-like protein
MVKIRMPSREIGPLASLFPCSESKILDHMVTMKGLDYSISDISRISGVNFKTTQHNPQAGRARGN